VSRSTASVGWSSPLGSRRHTLLRLETSRQSRRCIFLMRFHGKPLQGERTGALKTFCVRRPWFLVRHKGVEVGKALFFRFVR
jgi:hypothetical protein